MDNMKCWECALKHLAAALSYGKEVMTGHSKGADLDHRPDLIGELINAEHHTELLDRDLFYLVSGLRKELQSRHGLVTPADLDMIRGLYLKTEALSEGAMPASVPPPPLAAASPSPDYPHYPEALDVVFDKVDNLEFFRLAYESIRKNLSNCGKLYVLESPIDLSRFAGVTVVGKSLTEFMKQPELSEDFLLWKQNMAVVKPFDAKRSFAAYSEHVTAKLLEAVKPLLIGKGRTGNVSLWDDCKPQPVNKTKYQVLMDGIVTDYPLTMYFCLKEEPQRFNVRNSVAIVERPVCCSTKGQLRTCTFACWNQIGFASLVSNMNQK